MLTSPAPAPPTTSTTTSSASSSTPLHSRRLRGLSYLRSYTQNHLYGHSSHHSSHTQPQSPPAPGAPVPSASAVSRTNPQPLSPTSEATPEPSVTVPAQETTGTDTREALSLQSAVDPVPAASRPVPEPPATISSPPTTTSSPAPPPPPPPPPPPTSSVAPSGMTRNRAQTDGAAQLASNSPAMESNSDTNDHAVPKWQLPTIRLVPHQDPRSARPSLIFPPITRTLPATSSIIRVGRYSERDSTTEPSVNTPSAAPVGFKSKVVSRRHCELWCEDGQWYIKDVRSSSGTFLNHIRLSQPGAESDKFKIKDGDVIQLGIDFRGGEEMIFRCVKIRVECNRGWQRGINEFNKSTHQQLQKLAKSTRSEAKKVTADNASTHSSECAICLMSIAPCQSLFVAPCSHVWHYKCIRKLLNGPTYPIFLCPNCRAVADLEADVEEPEDDGWEEALEDHPPLTPRQPSVEPANSTDAVDHNGAAATGSPDSNNIDIEDVSRRMSHISLLPGPVSDRIPPFDPNGLDTPVNSGELRSSATSQPVPVPPRASSRDALEVGSPNGLENPMTPRNDAGPFILDGGAGQAVNRQASERGRIGGGVDLVGTAG